MNEIFNSREQALYLWMFIILISVIIIPSTRKHLPGIIRIAFSSQFLCLYAIMLLYTLGIVFIFYKCSLWNASQLKNTIVWFLFSALASFFAINKIKSENEYIKEAIKETFSYTLVAEYLIGFYTFNFWVEFLSFPILILIIGMLVFTDKDPRYLSVKKLLSKLLSIIGLFLVGYTAYKLITEFDDFAVIGTLSDFLIPPALSIAFLPFIILLSKYLKYEANFTKVKFAIKDPYLSNYARLQALAHFGFSTQDLERWSSSLFIEKVDNKQDIIRSMKKLKQLKKIEKNPPVVNPVNGWSPYAAIDFLKYEGMETGYYKYVGENEWMACSTYLKLDDDLLANNIAYCAEGNEQFVQKLKIQLNVNNPNLSATAHLKFLSTAKELFSKALGIALPEDVEMNITEGTDYYSIYRDKEVKIAKNIWEGHKDHGYNLNLIIQLKC
ncbi:hypothetical protein HGH92_08485 [Chitinophaga varians]|uniref:Uncharacterized protein n=1 Tax=Chitinophaga varians TaxID=2202339 RepID=A0A847REA3_9BACT|nr:hypothetical protein [Chitinophaga varians]NLR64340.1 hypothetical protein [Chitinophaga varians]